MRPCGASVSWRWLGRCCQFLPGRPRADGHRFGLAVGLSQWLPWSPDRCQPAAADHQPCGARPATAGGRRASAGGEAATTAPDSPDAARVPSLGTQPSSASGWSREGDGATVAAMLLPSDSWSEGEALRLLACRAVDAAPRRSSRLAVRSGSSLASAASSLGSRQSSRAAADDGGAGQEQAPAPAHAVAAVAAERGAEAATCRAELACVLAPLLPPGQRPGLPTASTERLVQLVAEVADGADGRALLELLSVAGKAARCGAELRRATLPAAVALLAAAAARTKPTHAARLPPEHRLGRRAALTLHTLADGAWRWAPCRSDEPVEAALKEEGRRYLRCVWSWQFSDLPGWSSPYAAPQRR